MGDADRRLKRLEEYFGGTDVEDILLEWAGQEVFEGLSDESLAALYDYVEGYPDGTPLGIEYIDELYEFPLGDKERAALRELETVTTQVFKEYGLDNSLHELLDKPIPDSFAHWAADVAMRKLAAERSPALPLLERVVARAREARRWDPILGTELATLADIPKVLDLDEDEDLALEALSQAMAEVIRGKDDGVIDAGVGV